jgi:NADH-quinone oxidoreductase subunit J
MELLIFYAIAAFSIALALLVITNKSPIGSAICLIAMMLGLAGIFALQRAHFIAVLQILVYAGAIMVLFMFVIMLLNLKDDDKGWKMREKNTLLSALTGLLSLGVLYKMVKIATQTALPPAKTLGEDFGTVATIGKALFTDFVLPFEVASVLLLVAMIGAVVLAKSKVD